MVDQQRQQIQQMARKLKQIDNSFLQMVQYNVQRGTDTDPDRIVLFMIPNMQRPFPRVESMEQKYKKSLVARQMALDMQMPGSRQIIDRLVRQADFPRLQIRQERFRIPDEGVDMPGFTMIILKQDAKKIVSELKKMSTVPGTPTVKFQQHKFEPYQSFLLCMSRWKKFLKKKKIQVVDGGYGAMTDVATINFISTEIPTQHIRQQVKGILPTSVQLKQVPNGIRAQIDFSILQPATP